MSDRIHVFVYDPALREERHALGLEKVRDASVRGTLFHVDDVGPALVLAGSERVAGEVLRSEASALDALDARARVRARLYRRVGILVDRTPCWTWVAGPALAPRLAPARWSRADEEDRS